MRGAHHIDVGLLEQLDVPYHRLSIHRTPGSRVMFMPVDAFELEDLSVDGKEFALDSHLFDAEPPVYRVDNLFAGVLQGQVKIIQMRSLCGPKQGMIDEGLQRNRAL